MNLFRNVKRTFDKIPIIEKKKFWLLDCSIYYLWKDIARIFFPLLSLIWRFNIYIFTSSNQCNEDKVLRVFKQDVLHRNFNNWRHSRMEFIMWNFNWSFCLCKFFKHYTHKQNGVFFDKRIFLFFFLSLFYFVIQASWIPLPNIFI